MKETESLDALNEALTHATREEAMARSKGWAVADDWGTMKKSIALRIARHKVEQQSLATAWACVDANGVTNSVWTDEERAQQTGVAFNMKVVPLYGIHHGK